MIPVTPTKLTWYIRIAWLSPFLHKQCFCHLINSFFNLSAPYAFMVGLAWMFLIFWRTPPHDPYGGTPLKPLSLKGLPVVVGRKAAFVNENPGRIFNKHQPRNLRQTPSVSATAAQEGKLWIGNSPLFQYTRERWREGLFILTDHRLHMETRKAQMGEPGVQVLGGLPSFSKVTSLG